MTASATSHKLIWPVRLVALALLAALAFVVVQIVIALINPESLWTQDDVTSTTPISTSAGPQSFSFTSDPFNNTALDIPIDVDVEALDVPETTLNLKLTGFVTGENGSANLRTPDNMELQYRVGDEVISDVILKSINKGFVVLSVNGQSQRLTFERDDTVGLTQPKPSGISYQAPPRSNETFNKNVGSLFQNINLRRSMKNGEFQGYTVRPNRSGVDIQKFGLEKGDVITQIDGQNINQGRPDFASLLQKASQQGGIDVTVLRNGTPRKIKLGSN